MEENCIIVLILLCIFKHGLGFSLGDWIEIDGCYSLNGTRGTPNNTYLSKNEAGGCLQWCQTNTVALKNSTCFCMGYEPTRAQESLCNISCSGDPRLKCGGIDNVSVYKARQDISTKWNSSNGSECLTYMPSSANIKYGIFEPENCSARYSYYCRDEFKYSEEQCNREFGGISSTWFGALDGCRIDKSVYSHLWPANDDCREAYASHEKFWVAVYQWTKDLTTSTAPSTTTTTSPSTTSTTSISTTSTTSPSTTTRTSPTTSPSTTNKTSTSTTSTTSPSATTRTSPTASPSTTKKTSTTTTSTTSPSTTTRTSPTTSPSTTTTTSTIPSTTSPAPTSTASSTSTMTTSITPKHDNSTITSSSNHTTGSAALRTIKLSESPATKSTSSSDTTRGSTEAHPATHGVPDGADRSTMEASNFKINAPNIGIGFGIGALLGCLISITVAYCRARNTHSHRGKSSSANQLLDDELSYLSAPRKSEAQANGNISSDGHRGTPSSANKVSDFQLGARAFDQHVYNSTPSNNEVKASGNIDTSCDHHEDEENESAFIGVAL